MKASELITELQRLIGKYGDQQIFIKEEGCGGYSMSTMFCYDGVEEITPYELGEDYSGEPDNDLVKEIFNIDIGDEDYYEWLETYEGDKVTLHFTIGSNSLIYGT